MKNISKLALASLVSLSLGSAAMAAQQQPVAKLLQVSGKALVETTDGERQVAKKGMPLAEGSHIVVLEKSKITVGYLSSDCKVIHQQNTLLTVQETDQCGAGQPLSVGAAGAAAVPPKTVAAGKTATIPPIMKGMGVGSMNLGSGALPALALGGLALAAVAASDDDDGDSGNNNASLSGLSLASGFFDANGSPVLAIANADGTFTPVDANGNPVPAGVNVGLFNASGALIDSTGAAISPFRDGNGNVVPVNAAGQPLDGNGNPITGDLAGSGLTDAATGQPASGTASPVPAGATINANGQLTSPTGELLGSDGQPVSA